MRGYLFTALTVLMFMSVFMVTYYFYMKSSTLSRQDIYAEKVEGVFDDVAADLESLLGISVHVENAAAVTVRIDDSIPSSHDISRQIRGYAAFLNTTYGEEINLGLRPDLSALSSSTSAVDITINPYSYAYGWGNLSKKTVWLRNLTAQTEPSGINATLDYRGEGINDIIWLEAENFTADAGVKTPDPDASEEEYMEDFNQLTATVNVPFPINYTLWVRVVEDNSSKNFTVEVDGKNSTRFDIRDYDATTKTYGWFNDTAVTFNLTAGDMTVKIIPDPASGTESVDAIVLTTKYADMPNTPPISRPRDQFEAGAAGGGDLSVGLEVLFANANYTYYTSSLSRTSTSQWNITFDDNDSVMLRFGGITNPARGAGSMLITVNDTVNGSRGLLNTTVTFAPQTDDIYVDSGCSLSLLGPISRNDRIWLMRG